MSLYCFHFVCCVVILNFHLLEYFSFLSGEGSKDIKVQWIWYKHRITLVKSNYVYSTIENTAKKLHWISTSVTGLRNSQTITVVQWYYTPITVFFCSQTCVSGWKVPPLNPILCSIFPLNIYLSKGKKDSFLRIDNYREFTTGTMLEPKILEEKIAINEVQRPWL